MEANYQKLLEEFRGHYKRKFGVQMDDDILYLLIRINELHKDLKKDIARIPDVRFTSGRDYFLYGLGRGTFWLLLISILSITAFVIFTK